MTQAVNLANFANNVDSSGNVTPSALNAAVPVSKGGTNATTASGARTNLGLAIGTDIPSPTGSGASGTWGINISGNATTATSATNATNAVTATNATNVISGGSIASNVTATTQSNGDNSTKIATTAYVQNMEIGWNQTYNVVTSSRAFSTNYTNSTGKPILVIVAASSTGGPGGGGGLTATVGGVTFTIAEGRDTGLSQGYPAMAGTFIVPNGATYQVSPTGITNTLDSWTELR